METPINNALFLEMCEAFNQKADVDLQQALDEMDASE